MKLKTKKENKREKGNNTSCNMKYSKYRNEADDST